MQTDSKSYTDFFEALRFPSVNTDPQNQDAPMNTLDQPYMDVLVARHPPGWVGDQTRDNIVQYFKLYEQVNPEAALKSPAMDKKCRMFSNWIFHKEFQDKGEACSRIF